MIIDLKAAALLIALTLSAGVAVADASDQVQVTARGAGHVPPIPDDAPEATQAAPGITGARLTTDEQIAAWIAAAPRAAAPTGLVQQQFSDDAAGPAEILRPERRMHGSVSAAVGSHGYRGASLSVTAPVGDDGWVSFNYSQSEGGPGYAPRYGYGYGPYGAFAPYGRRHDPQRFGPLEMYGPGGLMERDAAAPWMGLDTIYGW